MKLIRLLAFGSIIFLFGCQNNTKTKHQSQKMTKDSVKVLLREHYKVDTMKAERTVFLDYKRHSEYKTEYYKADSLFLKRYWVTNIFKSKKPKNLVINTDKKLLATYINISRLKGSYILFSQGMDDIAYSLAYVKDSTITFLHMEGWFVYYYNKIEQSNHRTIIDTKYNSQIGDSLRIGIKTINKAHNIQIWKITRIENTGKTSTYYELKAPLDYALRLPILVIQNTMGLDTMYKGIDKLDLKKMYDK